MAPYRLIEGSARYAGKAFKYAGKGATSVAMYTGKGIMYAGEGIGNVAMYTGKRIGNAAMYVGEGIGSAATYVGKGVKKAAIWSKEKALAFIMRCMPSKDDFSETEQAKFRFRKTEYLQYKDAKGKKWFYDTLLLNDPNTRVETFEVKGNEYVCVITDQFPEDFTALLWKEKYQGIITDSKYGAYHINVYYNPKQKYC